MRWASCVCVSAITCACFVVAAQQQQEQQAEWQGQVVEDWPSDSRGNWYIKRQYVRQAEDVYRNIRESQKQVEQHQDTLVQQRDRILNTIWDFYTEYQIDVSQMMQRVTDILQQLEQQSPDHISQQERQWIEKARGYKASLQDIQEHITSLQQFQDAVKKAVTFFEDQLEQVDAYEQKAWELYQKIAQTISDRVAQEEYRQLQGIQANADQIVTYIKDTLTSYLQNALSQVNTYIARAKETLRQIEEGGITLRKQIEQNHREEQQGSQAKQKEEQRSQQEQQNDGAEPQDGLISRIRSWIYHVSSTIGSWIYALWETVRSYVVGSD